jgi:hypothetical protein
MTTSLSTHDTTADQTVTPKEVYFEIVTLDGAVYRKDQPAPPGTVTSTAGANVGTVVQSYAEVGDWIEIGLTKGYAVSFHETRIARFVTRTT